MTRSWVTLVGALVALSAGLAAYALTGLRNARGPQGTNLIWDLLRGDLGGFLLSVAFWLAVGALLVVIVTAVVSLMSASPRGGRREPTSAGIVSGVKPPPPVEPRDPSGDDHWIDLAEGCIEVIDELDQNAEGFDSPRRDLAEHVVLRLEEVLERSGVEVITNDAIFDRARHRPVPSDGAATTGVAISETLSPGFAVGHRVLRRARVRVE
jgi:hypothetical protein